MPIWPKNSTTKNTYLARLLYAGGKVILPKLPLNIPSELKKEKKDSNGELVVLTIAIETSRLRLLYHC